MKAVDELLSWSGRIHIGRWLDREEWGMAIERKAERWLAGRIPHVATVWKGNGGSVQLWQTGGLLLGLEHDCVRAWVQDKFNMPGSNVHLPEMAFLAYALAKHGSLPEALASELDRRLECVTGTFPYRGHDTGIRYVDTIGLLCPYLYLSEDFERADRQIAEYDNALLHGIYPAHAYDMHRQLPLGVFDWGRGMAWYCLGLMESTTYQERMIELARKLLSFQKADGSFGSFYFNLSSRSDSSATAVFGLTFLRAFEMTGEQCFFSAAEKVETYLMRVTRRDGTVDYSQGDTIGIGMYSDRYEILPFTQGISLLLHKRMNAIMA